MTPMEYADEYFRLNFERQADLAREGQQLRPLEEEIAFSKMMIAKIIKAAIKEEREACAMIADEMKAELNQQIEKLQYGRTQIEVAEYIGQQIRARSS